MVVLVGAALHREQVLLVLDVAPQQVAERPQRIDLEVRERVAAARRADVLEAPAIALMLCTSMPSSCQYDQISSSRHGTWTREASTPLRCSADDFALAAECVVAAPGRCTECDPTSGTGPGGRLRSSSVTGSP